MRSRKFSSTSFPRGLRLLAAGFVSLATLIGPQATGLATAAEGVRFSRMAPEGAVPLLDGDRPAPGATSRQARAKKRLNALGLLTLAAETALVGVNAAFSQESFRRPPARRWYAPALR